MLAPADGSVTSACNNAPSCSDEHVKPWLVVPSSARAGALTTQPPNREHHLPMAAAIGTASILLPNASYMEGLGYHRAGGVGSRGVLAARSDGGGQFITVALCDLVVGLKVSGQGPVHGEVR
jgi:hypothetical protein